MREVLWYLLRNLHREVLQRRTSSENSAILERPTGFKSGMSFGGLDVNLGLC